MKRLHVTVADHIHVWMVQQIENGRYISYSEIVREALDILRRSHKMYTLSGEAAEI